MAKQFYSRDLTQNSNVGGVIMITVPNPAADITHTASRLCVSCIVRGHSGTLQYMNIGTACTAENGFKLSSTIPMYVPISDVQLLHFFGTAGDKIQIVWFG